MKRSQQRAILQINQRPRPIFTSWRRRPGRPMKTGDEAGIVGWRMKRRKPLNASGTTLLFRQCRLRRCEPRDWDAEWTTAHVIKTEPMAKFHRVRIYALFPPNP